MKLLSLLLPSAIAAASCPLSLASAESDVSIPVEENRQWLRLLKTTQEPTASPPPLDFSFPMPKPTQPPQEEQQVDIVAQGKDDKEDKKQGKEKEKDDKKKDVEDINKDDANKDQGDTNQDDPPRNSEGKSGEADNEQDGGSTKDDPDADEQDGKKDENKDEDQGKQQPENEQHEDDNQDDANENGSQRDTDADACAALAEGWVFITDSYADVPVSYDVLSESGVLRSELATTMDRALVDLLTEQLMGYCYGNRRMLRGTRRLQGLVQGITTARSGTVRVDDPGTCVGLRPTFPDDLQPAACHGLTSIVRVYLAKEADTPQITELVMTVINSFGDELTTTLFGSKENARNNYGIFELALVNPDDPTSVSGARSSKSNSKSSSELMAILLCVGFVFILIAAVGYFAYRRFFMDGATIDESQHETGERHDPKRNWMANLGASVRLVPSRFRACFRRQNHRPGPRSPRSKYVASNDTFDNSQDSDRSTPPPPPPLSPNQVGSVEVDVSPVGLPRGISNGQDDNYSPSLRILGMATSHLSTIADNSGDMDYSNEVGERGTATYSPFGGEEPTTTYSPQQSSGDDSQSYEYSQPSIDCGESTIMPMSILGDHDECEEVDLDDYRDYATENSKRRLFENETSAKVRSTSGYDDGSAHYDAPTRSPSSAALAPSKRDHKTKSRRQKFLGKANASAVEA